jgi:hypothetical protein
MFVDIGEVITVIYTDYLGFLTKDIVAFVFDRFRAILACFFSLPTQMGFSNSRSAGILKIPPAAFEAHRSLQIFLGVSSSVIQVSMFVLFLLRKGSLREL